MFWKIGKKLELMKQGRARTDHQRLMEGALMNGLDAVIIQICNVCVGNCSNFSNMQCWCGIFFKYFKYAMLVRDILQIFQICNIGVGYCSNILNMQCLRGILFKYENQNIPSLEMLRIQAKTIESKYGIKTNAVKMMKNSS